MSERREDPIYTSSLREALVALGAWCVCGVYTLTYCFLTAYDRPPGELETTWGIPNWVLYGVFLPWTLCNVFAWWFCFRFIQDGDLGAGEAPSGGADPDQGSADGLP